MAARGTQLSHLASCHVPASVKTDPRSSCSGIMNDQQGPARDVKKKTETVTV